MLSETFFFESFVNVLLDVWVKKFLKFVFATKIEIFTIDQNLQIDQKLIKLRTKSVAICSKIS